MHMVVFGKYSNPCRYKYSSRHFIIPVILYSFIYNLPKFWELTMACPRVVIMSNTSGLINSTISTTTCQYSQMVLVARDIR